LSVHCLVVFCLGILPVNILYFNQSNPSITLPYPSPLTRIVQQFSVFFIMACYLIHVMNFNIIQSIILFFFSFSFRVSSNCLCLYLGLYSTYDRKHVTFVFPNLAYFA
jgi:hypothetical protein